MCPQSPVVTMDKSGRIWINGVVVGPSVRLLRDFTGPQLLALKDFL